MRQLMVGFKKITCCLIIILTLCGMSNSIIVRAEEIQYENKVISDLNKTWKISFTNDLDFSTLNKDTIKILDEKGTAIDLSFSQGDSLKECIISPVKPYENQKSYTLFISNEIKSVKQKPLKNSTKMNFKVDVSASQIYTGSAKVQLGLMSAFKTITIDSCTLPNAKKYRIQESTKIVNIGEDLRLLITDESTTIYFYTEDEKLIGTATLSVKENNSKLTFNIMPK